MDKNIQEEQLQVELNDETAEGIYVNFAIVSHSPAEFVFDFIRILPGVNKARVKSRVVMTPLQAKGFLTILQKNLSDYEQQIGKIGEEQQKQIVPFMGVKGMA